ncbi:MAG: zinc ribbon domain-containing protein [Vulcanimicrobiota bacterium]
MKCLRCGADNPSGARYCLACRTPIPLILQSMEVKPPTPVLTFLRKIRNEIESGTIEGNRILESYNSVLEHMVTQRQIFLQKLESLTPALGQQSLQDTVAAMESFIEAVEEMASYLEDGDLAHVKNGMDKAESADVLFQSSLQPDDEIAFSLTRRTVILPPKGDQR